MCSYPTSTDWWCTAYMSGVHNIMSSIQNIMSSIQNIMSSTRNIMSSIQNIVSSIQNIIIRLTHENVWSQWGSLAAAQS